MRGKIEAAGAPGLIRQAVETVLSDPGYRKRALQLGNRMRGGQGAQGAVDWIKGRMMKSRSPYLGASSRNPNIHGE